ncbi:ATP-dependent nuclease [Priestia megaterium]|uniref:ATP-dependent nuclease n=1 Tax=Priestia megaterium TaxID=1404 RepID=UPI00159BA778|nr:ATP-binding protein [Priestia megaterium]
MIDGLYLGSSIIQDGYLADLKKLNVFIGKNNVGKSTILKEILNLNAQNYGIKMNIEDINNLFETKIKKIRNETAEQYRNEFDSCLDRIFSVVEEKSKELEKEIWYQEDIRSLFQEIWKKLFDEIGIPFQSYFREVFEELSIDNESLFNGRIEETSLALIPVKRDIENSKEVNHLEEAETSGKHVLDNLFHYATQLPDSSLSEQYELIKEQFKEISNGLDFSIQKDNQNNLNLYFTNPAGGWVTADKCGLGLQDLLIILFFANSPSYNGILIDEIEAHLHPDMQRRLLSTLKEKTDKQYFITTHSNIFLDNNFVDKVFHVSFNNNINIKDATSKSEILNDLGFSVTDNLTSDLIILTEGPTDKGVLDEFLLKMGLLNKFNIKIWPLGGDIMAQLDLSTFRDTYNIIALIDNDPGSRSIRNKFKTNCEKHNIRVHQLKRYAIENYFSVDALRYALGSQIKEDLTCIDPGVKLEHQIGLDPKKKNKKIASAMSLDEIKDTDLYEFLVQVKEMVTKESYRLQPTT